MQLINQVLDRILFSSIVYLYISLFLIYFLITILIPGSVKNSIPAKIVTWITKFGQITAYLIIINYILLLVLYASHSNFFDHAEPNIATVSWLFQTGKPIYHGLDAAERYTIPYGPMLYVINGFFLNLLKPSIFSAKIGGVLAGGLSLILIFFTLKKVVGSKIATLCSAYISLNFIAIDFYFSASTFWNRSDSFLLMFVALGLLAVLRTNPLLAILLSAVSLGISVNLKIHAFLYFLPIYVLLYLRSGIYSTLLSIFGSIILTIVPYICFPQVSVNTYILWLSEFGQQGISLNLLKGNIIWSLYLLAPIIFLFLYFTNINKIDFNAFIKNNKYFIYSVLISLGVVCLMGSKQAAGMNHLVPFFPIFAYLFGLSIADLFSANKQNNFIAVYGKYFYFAYISLILALLTVTFLRAMLNESHFITLSKKYNSEPVKEIHQIIKSYPNITIGMGYGKTYSLTFYRPILVYGGNPYLIDAPSLMDAEFLGKNVTNATLEALSSCQTELWLIPKGDKPFQIESYFNKHQVFSEKITSIFEEHYELREQTKYYDLWFCKK